MLHSDLCLTDQAADQVSAPTKANNGSFLTCTTFQEAIQLDGEILFALLRRISPIAYRHLEKHKIDPILYMTEWFMCAFSRTLPWASVLRVWDMFLCDGNSFLYPLKMWGQSQTLKHTHQSSSPSARSENNLPRGFGVAEVHVGNSGEAEGLSGPVWNHGTSPSHRGPIYAGGLPCSRGKKERLHISPTCIKKCNAFTYHLRLKWLLQKLKPFCKCLKMHCLRDIKILSESHGARLLKVECDHLFPC